MQRLSNKVRVKVEELSSMPSAAYSDRGKLPCTALLVRAETPHINGVIADVEFRQQLQEGEGATYLLRQLLNHQNRIQYISTSRDEQTEEGSWRCQVDCSHL